MHDVRGRLVRVLADRRLAAGVHALAWDGRDDSGRAAAHGVYVLRVASAGRVVARKLTLVR
jgi:flagellar hook assembly protein FlgD